MDHGAACFGDLPLPLASRIVYEALQADGATLRAWLQLSLVCKTWQSLVLAEGIELALPSDNVPTVQWQTLRQWVRTTRVRINTLQLGVLSASPSVAGASRRSRARMRTAERPPILS